MRETSSSRNTEQSNVGTGWVTYVILSREAQIMSLRNNKMANIWEVKLVGSSKIQLSPQLLIEKLQNSTLRS